MLDLDYIPYIYKQTPGLKHIQSEVPQRQIYVDSPFPIPVVEVDRISLR
jgi:hypothetical protein